MATKKSKGSKVKNGQAVVTTAPDPVLPPCTEEPRRWCQVLWVSRDKHHAIVRIVNGVMNDYLYHKIDGVVCSLTKLEPERTTCYFVWPDEGRCSCPGNVQHSDCKHVRSLLAMKKEGKL